MAAPETVTDQRKYLLGVEHEQGLPVRLPASAPPILLLVVDTEEEFDWGRPFSRANRSVLAIQKVPGFQAQLEDLGVRPTYCIDHPVATEPASAAVFAAIAARGSAEIGAHLHPWVTPPDAEPVNRFNSYPANLDLALERMKLTALTKAIRENVGVMPKTFKAGRYGIAPRTFDVLRELGFRVDLSSAPGNDMTADGGPDFTGYPNTPYWLPGNPPILEIPTTGGSYGPLWRLGRHLVRRVNPERPRRHYALGVLRRARLLHHATLTPEGFDLKQLQTLVDSLLDRGERVLTLSLHSPSLAVGHTPFVRSESDLADLMSRIVNFTRWFAAQHHGRFMTASEVHELLSAAPAA
jgi:peptidoglycan/xylan/chitin deacetylase (PgdA/CDA1 family)